MSDQIEGLAQLQEKLAKLGLDMGPALKRGLLKGAYILERASMENTPVDTGFLRASHEVVETDEGVEMRVGAEYAFYVEYGTSKMEAQPYVRPAIASESDRIVEAVAEEAKKIL